MIMDSPLFSTIVAQTALAELKGTALTFVNCIGYTITIISIQLLDYLWLRYDTPWVLMILVIGPLGGVISLLVYPPKLSTPQ